MKKDSLLIAAFIIAIAIIIGLIYFGQPEVVGAKSFDAYLTVGDKLGFNVDTNAIYFGTVPQGASAERNITITSDFDYPSIVSMNATGDFANWIFFGENNFILGPKDAREVTLRVTVPANAEKKDYSGKINVHLLKQ